MLFYHMVIFECLALQFGLICFEDSYLCVIPHIVGKAV